MASVGTALYVQLLLLFCFIVQCNMCLNKARFFVFLRALHAKAFGTRPDFVDVHLSVFDIRCDVVLILRLQIMHMCAVNSKVY